MNSKLTIVTPTIGRSSLLQTINSVIGQKDPNWKYVIVFDGVPPNFSSIDSRIKTVAVSKTGIEGTNIAGKVCQIGVDLSDTEYVGFVDDDDTLKENYVSEFHKIVSTSDFDEIIFKMIYTDGIIVPFDKYVDFGNVGMSFILRKQFLIDKKISFDQHKFYDWKMTFDVWQNGGRIFFSDEVCYNVRH